MFKAVIVDDEEDIRYLIRYLVEKSKHKVEIVGEANDALSGIALWRFFLQTYVCPGWKGWR